MTCSNMHRKRPLATSRCDSSEPAGPSEPASERGACVLAAVSLCPIFSCPPSRLVVRWHSWHRVHRDFGRSEGGKIHSPVANLVAGTPPARDLASLISTSLKLEAGFGAICHQREAIDATLQRPTNRLLSGQYQGWTERCSVHSKVQPHALCAVDVHFDRKAWLASSARRGNHETFCLMFSTCRRIAFRSRTARLLSVSGSPGRVQSVDGRTALHLHLIVE